MMSIMTIMMGQQAVVLMISMMIIMMSEAESVMILMIGHSVLSLVMSDHLVVLLVRWQAMVRGGMVLIKDMGVLMMTERVISHMMRHAVMLKFVMGCSVMIALLMVSISDVMA